MEFRRRFYFEAFGYNVHVILTDDLQATAARIGKQARISGEPISSRTRGFTMQDQGAPIALIVLSTERNNPVVAHESFHAVWHLMQHIGAQHEEEVMAYCLDTIVNWIDLTYAALEKQFDKRLDKKKKV